MDSQKCVWQDRGSAKGTVKLGRGRRQGSQGKLEHGDIRLSHPLLGRLELLGSSPVGWPGLIHMGMTRFPKKNAQQILGLELTLRTHFKQVAG